MKSKKKILNVHILVIFSTILMATLSARAQQPGTGRTELQRDTLSVAGREVVQVRVYIDPGVTFPRHSHPGEEVIYVLEGLLEYQIDERTPVVLKAGEVFFIPAGKIHKVKNIGTVRGIELATYIVEKDKPLVTISN